MYDKVGGMGIRSKRRCHRSGVNLVDASENRRWATALARAVSTSNSWSLIGTSCGRHTASNSKARDNSAASEVSSTSMICVQIEQVGVCHGGVESTIDGRLQVVDATFSRARDTRRARTRERTIPRGWGCGQSNVAQGGEELSAEERGA